jgi:hypothetical protein
VCKPPYEPPVQILHKTWTSDTVPAPSLRAWPTPAWLIPQHPFANLTMSSLCKFYTKSPAPQTPPRQQTPGTQSTLTDRSFGICVQKPSQLRCANFAQNPLPQTPPRQQAPGRSHAGLANPCPARKRPPTRICANFAQNPERPNALPPSSKGAKCGKMMMRSTTRNAKNSGRQKRDRVTLFFMPGTGRSTQGLHD